VLWFVVGYDLFIGVVGALGIGDYAGEIVTEVDCSKEKGSWIGRRLGEAKVIVLQDKNGIACNFHILDGPSKYVVFEVFYFSTVQIQLVYVYIDIMVQQVDEIVWVVKLLKLQLQTFFILILKCYIMFVATNCLIFPQKKKIFITEKKVNIVNASKTWTELSKFHLVLTCYSEWNVHYVHLLAIHHNYLIRWIVALKLHLEHSFEQMSLLFTTLLDTEMRQKYKALEIVIV
jgi:hypothetical protein